MSVIMLVTIASDYLFTASVPISILQRMSDDIDTIDTILFWLIHGKRTD
jgi:hypothetical protein